MQQGGGGVNWRGDQIRQIMQIISQFAIHFEKLFCSFLTERFAEA